MTRLVLVRHAEPSEDAHGRCYGSLDVGLSPAGHEHARRLAASLAALGPVAVHSSPRRRALDTATPLAAACGLVPVADDDLRELDFGELEGRRYEEIERDRPELYRAWMERPTEVRFPGGESYADLRVRALRAVERLHTAHGDGCAVAVTHGGIVRAALAHWLGMPDEAIFRLDQRYGGITIVDWLEGVPLVRLLNGTLTEIQSV